MNKALYGLKHAPRAWYSRLDKYLQEKGFKRGIMDNNLYIKNEGAKFLIVVVYVNAIIFGSNSDKMCQEFASKM